MQNSSNCWLTLTKILYFNNTFSNSVMLDYSAQTIISFVPHNVKNSFYVFRNNLQMLEFSYALTGHRKHKR